ncbi:MAG: hypothetical protein LBR10_05355 [Prevotellaceae bacterium]|jgi:hypothetical protein|nr:hypothetical protein [Prevotellaceae bacterium]
MSANKIFSPKRFCNLIYNDLLIYRKTYIFSILGIWLITYLILLWAMTVDSRFDIVDYLALMYMYYIVVGFSIGNAFPDFNNKIRTANYLLLPASTFEKFLSQFLLKVLIAFALSACIFWIDAHLAKWTASLIGIFGRIGVIADFSYNKVVFPNIIMTLLDKLSVIFAFFSLVTFVFSMRLFFEKFAIIKTVIFGVIMVLAFTGCMVLWSHIFYPETNGWDVALKGYEINDVSNVSWYVYFISFISWIFFLATGYYKLKEKQI